MAGLLLVAGTALGQTAAPAATAKLEFEVASVRPSAPLDMQKLQADIAAGKMPNFGMHLDGLRAEYNYMSMKELIVAAYKVKPYQVSGPAWLDTEHYDITARLPEGTKKDDAAAMLKALLEDRFKLAAHIEQKDQAVMALVVAKGGPKLKDGPAPPPIDEDAPLKPGERKIDLPDGPARYTQNIDLKAGGMTATVNMGTRGTYNQKIDGGTMTVQVDGTGVSMAGFVDILSQIEQIGGPGSRQVVDKTGLKGHYEVALSLSLADLIAATRAQGAEGGSGPAGGSNGGVAEASDPGGAGLSVTSSLEKLGLKLESGKAVIEQLIVDHAEKTPTEN